VDVVFVVPKVAGREPSTPAPALLVVLLAAVLRALLPWWRGDKVDSDDLGVPSSVVPRLIEFSLVGLLTGQSGLLCNDSGVIAMRRDCNAA
jgi:hypothetical protein